MNGCRAARSTLKPEEAADAKAYGSVTAIYNRYGYVKEMRARVRCLGARADEETRIQTEITIEADDRVRSAASAFRPAGRAHSYRRNWPQRARFSYRLQSRTSELRSTGSPILCGIERHRI
jgi:hypothetical protein